MTGPFLPVASSPAPETAEFRPYRSRRSKKFATRKPRQNGEKPLEDGKENVPLRVAPSTTPDFTPGRVVLCAEWSQDSPPPWSPCDVPAARHAQLVLSQSPNDRRGSLFERVYQPRSTAGHSGDEVGADDAVFGRSRASSSGVAATANGKDVVRKSQLPQLIKRPAGLSAPGESKAWLEGQAEQERREREYSRICRRAAGIQILVDLNMFEPYDDPEVF